MISAPFFSSKFADNFQRNHELEKGTWIGKDRIIAPSLDGHLTVAEVSDDLVSTLATSDPVSLAPTFGSPPLVRLPSGAVIGFLSDRVVRIEYDTQLSLTDIVTLEDAAALRPVVSTPDGGLAYLYKMEDIDANTGRIYYLRIAPDGSNAEKLTVDIQYQNQTYFTIANFSPLGYNRLIFFDGVSMPVIDIETGETVGLFPQSALDLTLQSLSLFKSSYPQWSAKVFAICHHGKVCQIDVNSLELTVLPIEANYPVFRYRNTVYALNQNGLFAIDTNSLNVLWSAKSPILFFNCRSSREFLFFKGMDGKEYINFSRYYANSVDFYERFKIIETENYLIVSFSCIVHASELTLVSNSGNIELDKKSTDEVRHTHHAMLKKLTSSPL